MSSPASRPRPRPITYRSRRQRLAAGAVLATTSLLGTYLAAIRPHPTYAAPNTGSEQGQGLVGSANVSVNALTLPTCAQADDSVTNETDLRNAIIASDDTSVICLYESFTVSSELDIDDTAVTIVGRDDSAVTLTGGGSNRFFDVNFAGSGKTVTFSNFTMTGGDAGGDGGAIDIGGGSNDDSIIIDGITFYQNEAGDDGGAIYAKELASLQVTDSTFLSNDTTTGDDGGGIYVINVTSFQVHGSTFRYNRADSSGGGIFVESAGEVVISTSTFDQNIAPGSDGGAIDLESGVTSARLTDDTFTRNYANDDGGAVWNAATNLTISGTTFTGNYVTGSSTEYGGALWTEGDVGISRSQFTNNRAKQGGAIWSDEELAISQTSFTSNTSSDEGGAIWSYGAITSTNNAFVNNEAGANGGAVYTYGIDDTQSLWHGNNALGNNRGGALFSGESFPQSVRNLDTVINGSTFTSNGHGATPPIRGGAVYFRGYYGSLIVTNSTFESNRARDTGGAIHIYAYYPYDDTIAYSTFVGNTLTSGTDGAGIYVGTQPNGYTSVLNSLLHNNTGGGGLASDFYDSRGSTKATIKNSLLTSNTSTNVSPDDPRYGDPNLGALTNNGGPLVGYDDTVLPTAAPPATSIAVGVANPDLTPLVTLDQVGSSRRVPGNSKTVGAITVPFTPPTPPTPTYPPSAPLTVTGTAADAAATITWTAPTSAGSFPITDYQAVLSPGGATCLVQAPALSCTITGLTNGTEYTATARALNGAGWGPYSTPSDPFTPENPTPPVTKTIVITGTRGTVDGKPGVYANGETTGLVGATVQARVKLAGQLEYRNGSTRIVQPDGSFQWQRKTGKKVYVYFIADDGEVRSNRVIIAAR